MGVIGFNIDEIAASPTAPRNDRLLREVQEIPLLTGVSPDFFPYPPRVGDNRGLI
jgi:hypothetical protein